MKISLFLVLCSAVICQDALQTKWKGKQNRAQGTLTAEFEFATTGITKGTIINLSARKLENHFDSGPGAIVATEASQIVSKDVEWTKEIQKISLEVPGAGIYSVVLSADKEQQPETVIKASQGSFTSYRITAQGLAGTTSMIRKEVESDLNVVESWRQEFQNLVSEIASYTKKEDIEAAAPDLLRKSEALFRRIGDPSDKQFKPISQLTATREAFEHGLNKIRVCLQAIVNPAGQKKKEEEKPSSSGSGGTSGSGRNPAGLSIVDPPNVERPKGERKAPMGHGQPLDLTLDASSTSRESLKKLVDTALGVAYRETLINILECESFCLKTATRGIESFKGVIGDAGDLIKSELKEIAEWAKAFNESGWPALAGAERINFQEVSELTEKVVNIIVSLSKDEKKYTLDDYAAAVQPAVQKLAELISKMRGV